MPKHLLSCTLTVGVFCSLGICSDADAAPLPFDVIATSTDPSGWWLDPKWGAQVSSPGMLPDPGACPNSQPWKPACTSVATWEDGSSWKCPGYGPHANFGGATYRGVIAWDEHSSNDDDYNFLLWPFGNAGFTASNPNGLVLEFDSDETIDHFHTSWWNALHQKVDSGDAKTWLETTTTHDAIAFGVLGLDCAHGCHSELHPVFALAVHVNADPNNDTWAIFVRNWGNEGYCSTGTEALDPSISSFTVFIPRAGATNVHVVSAEFLSRGVGASGPFVQFVPGGANVTFGFPPPDKRERINGVLKLQWDGTSATPAPYSATVNLDRLPLSIDVAEATWDRTKKQMSSAQWRAYLKLRPRRDLRPDIVRPAKMMRQPRPTPPQHRAIRKMPDVSRDRQDRAERLAVLTALRAR